VALSTYRPARQDIALGTEGFSVRGLNLNDAALLMAAHAQPLMNLYADFEKIVGDAERDHTALARIVMKLILELPVVAADIVAVAADEPDARDNVKALPFPVQVQALTEIMRLTFEAGGGLGNFLSALAGIARGLGIELPASQTFRLPTGSGSRERKPETVS
jgi:hypothetical protein